MAAMNRRSFFTGAAAGVLGGGAAGWFGSQRRTAMPAASEAPAIEVAPAVEVAPPQSAPVLAQAPISTTTSGKFGLPGPFRGRVIEVNRPGVVDVDNSGAKPAYTRHQDVVKAMVERGMRELVGTDEVVEAWKYFFSSGDRVGIKVVPNGFPLAMSSTEIVLEVIAGLESAGVRRRDMLVFDRYREEFARCDYVDRLPDGVAWDSSTGPGSSQIAIDGQPVSGGAKVGNVSGYDRDVWRELSYAEPGFAQDDDRRFRSHLSNIVSTKVDKIVCIPVLKDHGSAGITITLKNMSHGFVNNVARSHIAPSNTCETFIPEMVSLPQIREKAVLQIIDGLVGVYHGGPFPGLTWAHESLFFATDPVAMDRIGWEILDAQRAKVGLASVARMGTEGINGGEVNGVQIKQEAFHIRQPQYIQLAATLGLGEFDREKIDYQTIDLS